VPCDPSGKGQDKLPHHPCRTVSQRFAEENALEPPQQAAQFPELVVGKMVDDHCSHQHIPFDGLQRLEQVAFHPANAGSEACRPRLTVQSRDFGVREIPSEPRAKVTLARADLDDPSSRPARAAQHSRHPRLIPHERIDQPQVHPAPAGVRVATVHRIEQLGANDSATCHGPG